MEKVLNGKGYKWKWLEMDKDVNGKGSIGKHSN